MIAPFANLRERHCSSSQLLRVLTAECWYHISGWSKRCGKFASPMMDPQRFWPRRVVNIVVSIVSFFLCSAAIPSKAWYISLPPLFHACDIARPQTTQLIQSTVIFVVLRSIAVTCCHPWSSHRPPCPPTPSRQGGFWPGEGVAIQTWWFLWIARGHPNFGSKFWRMRTCFPQNIQEPTILH